MFSPHNFPRHNYDRPRPLRPCQCRDNRDHHHHVIIFIAISNIVTAVIIERIVIFILIGIIISTMPSSSFS